MNSNQRPETHERTIQAFSGWTMLAVGIALAVAALFVFSSGVRGGSPEPGGFPGFLIAVVGLIALAVLVFAGVGALAGWLPARRATRVDTVQVLNAE